MAPLSNRQFLHGPTRREVTVGFPNQSCVVQRGICCIKVLLLYSLAVLATALRPQEATAATYYVDFSGGSDANNGTSSGTAWRHCPGDPNASGTASSTTLAARDTVIFKGGVDYKGRINVNWSGSTGNPITYDGNSAGTFGTGKAVLNGEHYDSDSRRYGFYATGKQNVMFNNLAFTQFGGHSNITWTCSSLPSQVYGYGIWLTDPTNVVISSCYFYDLGDWTNAPNMDQSFMEGRGIQIDHAALSVTITNCEFTKIGHDAIWANSWSTSGISGVYVLNCDFHDYIRWSIEFTVGSTVNSVIKDIIMDGNKLHDLWQYSPEAWLGCARAWIHTDGIICFLSNPPIQCVLPTTNQPMIIRNNVFYNNYADTNATAGTACIFLTSWGGRCLIYNNTFVNVLNQGEGAIFLFDTPSPTNGSAPCDYWVVNNSFYDSRAAVEMQHSMAGWSLTNGTVRIKNNIFYKADTSFMHPIEAGYTAGDNPTELDYNIYVTGRNPPEIINLWLPGQSAPNQNTLTLPQAQTNGFEAHGIYGDPKYANISYGLGVNSSLNDLHLQSSSPAIGAGTNLTAIFTTDKDGHSRPAIGPWNMGAYEFPTPMKKLNVFQVR